MSSNNKISINTINYDLIDKLDDQSVDIMFVKLMTYLNKISFVYQYCVDKDNYYRDILGIITIITSSITSLMIALKFIISDDTIYNFITNIIGLILGLITSILTYISKRYNESITKYEYSAYLLKVNKLLGELNFIISSKINTKINFETFLSNNIDFNIKLSDVIINQPLISISDMNEAVYKYKYKTTINNQELSEENKVLSLLDIKKYLKTE